jgi:hypothetical protein
MEMIQRNSSLLDHHLKRVEKQMEYLIRGPVGKGAGSVTRRGISVPSVTTPREYQDTIL